MRFSARLPSKFAHVWAASRVGLGSPALSHGAAVAHEQASRAPEVRPGVHQLKGVKQPPRGATFEPLASGLSVCEVSCSFHERATWRRGHVSDRRKSARTRSIRLDALERETRASVGSAASVRPRGGEQNELSGEWQV